MGCTTDGVLVRVVNFGGMSKKPEWRLLGVVPGARLRRLLTGPREMW